MPNKKATWKSLQSMLKHFNSSICGAIFCMPCCVAIPNVRIMVQVHQALNTNTKTVPIIYKQRNTFKQCLWSHFQHTIPAQIYHTSGYWDKNIALDTGTKTVIIICLVGLTLRYITALDFTSKNAITQFQYEKQKL